MRRAEPHLTRRQALGLLTAGLAGCGRTVPAGCPAPPPMPASVNGCTLDPDRRLRLSPCMESSGPENVRDEWDNAVLHPHTVVYSCGRPARPGGPNDHDHPPGEIDLARRLSAGAAALIGEEDTIGSERDGGHDPFFLTANRGDPLPDAITPDVVRRLFGGVIYPAAEIVVEPLEERGKWWEAVRWHYGFEPDGMHRNPAAGKEREAQVNRWRALVKWFREQPELRGAWYVALGDNPLSATNGACVFPRLHVGLTRAGSLVGTWTAVVHT
jgi:hypothetical protein